MIEYTSFPCMVYKHEQETHKTTWTFPYVRLGIQRDVTPGSW